MNIVFIIKLKLITTHVNIKTKENDALNINFFNYFFYLFI